MEIDQLLTYIKTKVEEFEKLDHHSFHEFVNEKGSPKKGVLEFPGVYVVYEGGEAIWVGYAGKGKHVLKYRIGDMFSTDHHTLPQKLIERGVCKSVGEVGDYYFTKCKLRILETDTITHAKLIEAVLIHLLKPPYNQETQVI